MALLGFLLESGPVKATAKGNLPRALVLRWWDQEFGPRHDNERTRQILRPNQERGAWLLYYCRRIIRKAGLIKLHEHKFSITDKGRKIYEDKKYVTMYRALFLALGWEVSWNTGRTYYQILPGLVQQSFIFNLHLLGKLARDWIDGDALADAYLRAFPMLLDEYEAPDTMPIRSLVNISILYSLTHFPCELGLLDSRKKATDSYSYDYKLSPLFDRIIEWNL